MSTDDVLLGLGLVIGSQLLVARLRLPAGDRLIALAGAG
jgi:hypothetical protein